MAGFPRLAYEELLRVESARPDEEDQGAAPVQPRVWARHARWALPIAGLLFGALAVHSVVKPRWPAPPAASLDIAGTISLAATTRMQLAKEGQSCTAACKALGKQCDESYLEGGFDWSDSGIRAAAKEAGHTCGKAVGWGYRGTPGVCTNSRCCGDGSCTGWCSFGHIGQSSCSDKPSADYSRLCPCMDKVSATLFVLENDADPMVVLAAIPASAKANGGKPAVLLSPPSGDDPAFVDFAASYRPDAVYLIGSAKEFGEFGHKTRIPHGSAEAVSMSLAKKVWQKSRKVVIARSSSYAHALLAAPLAAKLSAPLLLVGGGGPSAELKALVRDLGVDGVFLVGDGWGSFDLGSVKQDVLSDASKVFDKMGSPRYLVVASPKDQRASDYTALSAFAPMLAAAHGGLVLPVTGTSSDAIKQEIKSHVNSKGLPDNMALFGGFNVIPVHCEKAALFDHQACADVPYAELDNDLFMDVGLGRMIAKDASSMSLLVSRIVAYPRILGSAEGKVALAGGHNRAIQLAKPLLENVGFTSKFLEGSEVDSGAKINVAGIVHTDHSGWQGLGGFYSGHTKTLLAPCVITSGGCATAGFFEHGSHPDSAVLQLLHNGAVGYVGGTRNKITAASQLHEEFWNELVKGGTMGEAHITAWNALAVSDADRGHDAGMRYVMMNTMLFGDPGFKLNLPSGGPKSKGAWLEETGRQSFTVHGPQWTKYTIPQGREPLKEWKWHANLYQYGAPGISSESHWAGKHDVWKPYFYAKVRTSQHVSSVTPVDKPTAPLGYGGHFHVDQHGNGNKTVWWRVRMLDYNWEDGRIKNELKSQKYTVHMS